MRALFPHVERPVVVPRPALVISHGPIGPDGLLLWVAMITNAHRETWPGDIPIPRAEALGLIIPSKIRCAKVMTVETASVSHIARLDEQTMDAVRRCVRDHLGI